MQQSYLAADSESMLWVGVVDEDANPNTAAIGKKDV